MAADHHHADHTHGDGLPHGSDVKDQGPHHYHFPGTLGERKTQRGRLRIVLVITSLFMVAEVVGGVISNSLALLADAGHMLTDVAALALALFAMRMAQRPPDSTRTYGYVRLEILAALINGAALLVIAVLICWEAYQRVISPPEVHGTIMLGVATVGLAVNLVGAFLLHHHTEGSLNVRGAYLHVLGDLLGSVGAIAAGLVILFTGWTLADPIISVFIALLILVSAWRLVREATEVLLEAAPSHMSVDEVIADLSGIPELEEVHDVHVWTLTSGFVAMSGHGVVDDLSQQREVLDEINRRMRAYGIQHVTFQVEPRRLHQLEATNNSGETPDGPEEP